MTWITAALSFLLFEVWIPWRHHGQTLGCRYTHMTIETRDRSRGQRIAFYAIRTLFFGVIFGGLATNHPIWGWTLLALLIFWLVKKCMGPIRRRRPLRHSRRFPRCRNRICSDE